MSVLTTPPTTDPTAILRYRDGLYASDLLAAAVSHLDFFTWLDGRTASTDAEICQHFGFAARPVDVMLTLFRANGLVATNGVTHRLTETAREHLVSTSPFFLGAYYDGMKDRPVALDYLSVLKSGRPANWASLEDRDDWHKAMLDEGFARAFTAAMDCRGLALGQALAKAVSSEIAERASLLDVGGGSGIYAATMLAANPHLRATVMEQTPVDSIASEAIRKHGLGDRIDVVSGNFFIDPWPEAEVHLLSNVLHDWDFPEVRCILERSAQSLHPGGLLIVHEVFIDDDKCGSIPAAEYSALLMHVTQGKCYTPSEYGAILEDIGFRVNPYQDTIGDRGFFTAVRL
ncbi:MAG: methyltransferase [Verrucomicrobiales bacterium]